MIAAFGGIRPMAHRLGIAVSTVQGWKERGTIPRGRHGEILAAAAAQGLAIDPALLAASDQTQAPTIEGTAQPVPPPSPEPKMQPPPPAADEPVPSGPRRGLLRHLPAALVGGLLVAAGFALAFTLERPAEAPDTAAIERRLAALETAAPSPPLDTAALQAEILAAVEARFGAAGGQDSAALQRLEAELAETRKSLADLAAKLTTLPAGGPAEADLTALQGRVAALEENLLTLQASLGALGQRLADLATTTEGLEGRLTERIEAALRSAPPPGPAPETVPALALAASELKAELAAGKPYAEALARLRQLAAGDAALSAPLDRLAPAAESGVASLEQLTADFAELAPQIVQAEATAAPGGDWLDGLLRDLGELVTVRPVGEVAGDETPARVARAERRLAEGDLAAAVAEIAALQGPAAAPAADWLARAEARLAALAAADELLAAALAASPAGG